MLARLNQARNEPQSDELLKLYWNRAGVKRELSNLKKERYELLDKLKEQEGAIIRAQEQLEGLERLLTNPVAAANAMVYFQLRHLWRVASLRIEQFAKELTAQRERRERSQLQGEVLAKRRRRLDAIRDKLNDLLQKRKKFIEEGMRYEQRIERLNFFMRLIIGHRLRRRINGMQKNRVALEERIEEFNEIIQKIQGEPLPEPDGISLESRRLINLAVIALAQHLVVHFSEHDLAKLARKAMMQSVGDMKFGDRRVCDQMVARIRERLDQLNSDKQLPDSVKTRADYLVNKVQYRQDSDATPIADHLAEIIIAPERDDHTGEAPLRANVLVDDYWDLIQVLY